MDELKRNESLGLMLLTPAYTLGATLLNMHALTSKPALLLKTVLQLTFSASLILSLQACAVVAVADAAITVVATGVKVTAKAVGAVANAVIPDGADD